MKNLTSYRDKAVNLDKKAEESLSRNSTTLAALSIICIDYFVSQMVVNGIRKLRTNEKYYTRKLKTASENLFSSISSKEHSITNTINSIESKAYIQCIADMCDEMDLKCIPAYKALEDEMANTFSMEYRLTESKELANIFAMDCLLFVANDIYEQMFKAFPCSNQKLVKLLSLEKQHEICATLCRESSNRTPENVKINLNKQLGIMSKKRKLMDTLTDPDLFSDSFVKAGFRLDKDEEKIA